MASPPPPPRGGVATSRRRETRAHPLLVHRWPRDIKEQRARVSAGINAAEPSSACSRLPVKNIFRTAFSPLRGRKVADPSTFYSSIYPSRLSFSRTQRILSLSLSSSPRSFALTHSLSRSLADLTATIFFHSRPIRFFPFVTTRWTRRRRDACPLPPPFIFIYRHDGPDSLLFSSRRRTYLDRQRHGEPLRRGE